MNQSALSGISLFSRLGAYPSESGFLRPGSAGQPWLGYSRLTSPATQLQVAVRVGSAPVQAAGADGLAGRPLEQTPGARDLCSRGPHSVPLAKVPWFGNLRVGNYTPCTWAEASVAPPE